MSDEIMGLVAFILHPSFLIHFSIDPAVGIMLRGALSLLLASAAAHKLRDIAGFRAALARYELLPTAWIGACTVGVIAMEVGVAAGLWLPGIAATSGLAAAGLFGVYAGAIVINLVRGRHDIDCGCAGVAGGQPLSGGVVIRNGVLVIVAVVITFPQSSRPLTWLDAITISAGVSTLALLYAAADGLLASGSRIAALATHHRRLFAFPHGGHRA